MRHGQQLLLVLGPREAADQLHHAPADRPIEQAVKNAF